MAYQLVPPHNHCCNTAETAIQTFKDPFIAILCRTDTSSTLYLWCRLLPHAEHTLNMLWTSRMTPTISVYAYLWGQQDYNTNPFAPLECKVQAHVTPTTRETWAAHTTTAYYVGNAWESYRCHSIYISDTRSIRICETVFFKHKYITMPSFTPANALLRAADNLTAAINGAMPRITVTKDAVDQLLKIFKIQAMATNNEVNQQRQRQTNAHTQRVRNKAMEEPDESWMDLIKSQEEEENITLPGPQRVTTATSLPIVEFKEVTNHQTNLHTHTPMITQDSTSNTPAYNTQQQRITRTLTQDIACQIIKVKLDMSQVAGRQYPLQYLCNWASAVLDNKTGNLLEY